mgnify:CR=1 FL=1
MRWSEEEDVSTGRTRWLSRRTLTLPYVVVTPHLDPTPPAMCNLRPPELEERRRFEASSVLGFNKALTLLGLMLDNAEHTVYGKVAVCCGAWDVPSVRPAAAAATDSDPTSICSATFQWLIDGNLSLKKTRVVAHTNFRKIP